MFQEELLQHSQQIEQTKKLLENLRVLVHYKEVISRSESMIHSQKYSKNNPPFPTHEKQFFSKYNERDIKAILDI